MCMRAGDSGCICIIPLAEDNAAIGQYENITILQVCGDRWALLTSSFGLFRPASHRPSCLRYSGHVTYAAVTIL